MDIQVCRVDRAGWGNARCCNWLVKDILEFTIDSGKVYDIANIFRCSMIQIKHYWVVAQVVED